MVSERSDLMYARLADIARQWDDLEGRLKEAEQLGNNVVIPALEELHYAGRRLVDLIHYLYTATEGTPRTPDFINGVLFETEQNIVRARHDIVDAIVATIHTYITKLANDVGETLLLQCFPKYAEMRGRIDEVTAFIVLSREQRRRRPEMYEDVYHNYLPDIIVLFKAIRASQPRIEAQIEKYEQEAEKQRTRQRLRDFITVMSVVLAIVGLGVGYWFWKNPIIP